jgi:hypothetical protein
MKRTSNPQEILKSFSHSRQLLIDLFQHVPSDYWFKKEEVGEWSFNDILIHFVGWDELMLQKTLLRIKGIKPEKGFTSEEEYNIEYIENHPMRNKNNAITTLKSSTDKILQFLKNLTQEETEYAINNKCLKGLDQSWHDMEHYKNLSVILKFKDL